MSEKRCFKTSGGVGAGTRAEKASWDLTNGIKTNSGCDGVKKDSEGSSVQRPRHDERARINIVGFARHRNKMR